jgi:hypothetical protein
MKGAIAMLKEILKGNHSNGYKQQIRPIIAALEADQDDSNANTVEASVCWTSSDVTNQHGVVEFLLLFVRKDAGSNRVFVKMASSKYKRTANAITIRNGNIGIGGGLVLCAGGVACGGVVMGVGLACGLLSIGAGFYARAVGHDTQVTNTLADAIKAACVKKLLNSGAIIKNGNGVFVEFDAPVGAIAAAPAL